MGELVKLLTTEVKTEEAASASLSQALASISTSIINDIPEVKVPGDAPASSPPQDPMGRPVTCGVLCFDEVQACC